MATWNRFDICLAHLALENDWNLGGWLHERPSNRRRMEATHVQLERMDFEPGPCAPTSFDGLLESEEYENAVDIYINALIAFGLAKEVMGDDAIWHHVQATYAPEWVGEHFSHLSYALENA